MGWPGGGASGGRVAAAVGVFLLLALIWAVVLGPPLLRAHAARQEAFILNLRSERLRAVDVRSERTRCRRRIARGLLVAIAATLLVGLLPTFRVLLVVHLFLVDSFIAYIALLAYWAGRAAAPADTAPARPGAQQWRREPKPRTDVLPELAPLG